MVEACGASDVESCVGEALGLGLRADGDAAWAPLVLAMAKIERLVFHRVRKGAQSGFLQMHDLWASNGGDALKFWGFATYRAFSQLGVVVRNEK